MLRGARPGEAVAREACTPIEHTHARQHPSLATGRREVYKRNHPDTQINAQAPRVMGWPHAPRIVRVVIDRHNSPHPTTPDTRAPGALASWHAAPRAACMHARSD